jgi:HAD superfamily hydrolase (TIGR01509 family)
MSAHARQYECMQAEEKQNNPNLLIFDCDGVLVDSEMLVCTAVSEELTRLGYAITPADVVQRFAGRPEWEIMREVAQDWGQPVPEDYFSAMKQRVQTAFTTELRAIDGAGVVLQQLRLQKCVASSSGAAKLEQGLRFVGLFEHFAPNVISAQRVAHGKPAPDVFIYAAGWMRTPVKECLVLEDSEPGVRAARAAGMRVFGFTGGSHCGEGHAERLLAAGAERVLEHMRELPEALPSAFVAGAVAAR